MRLDVKKGEFLRPGVTKGKTWAEFGIECRKNSECKILLYKRDCTDPPLEIPVSGEFSKGNLRSMRVDRLDLAEYDYNFWIDGTETLDPRARRIAGREKWADPERKTGLRSRYEAASFSWRSEPLVEILRKDMVIYKLHVRGFTMGLPESVPDRGTFLALEKKLSYLKSLGITSIELMPVYEFEELIPVESKEKEPEAYPEWKAARKRKRKKEEEAPRYRINYWGYGKGMYFAPKASYAAGESADAELKSCILQMHKKGMECILEMDFADDVPALRILEVLRFWVREYHVDGFHLQGGRIPMQLLMQDPYLGRTKLFYRGITEEMIAEEEKEFPRIFVDTDEFLYPCRRLAGGQDGNVWELVNQMKKQNERLGHINYIADNNGFTLADLFAYERKHNEANGQGNADGPVWSFSTNCGVEGESTSRNIQRIRMRRMKNAAAMLFLSQGVPMLMAGDEDCNSQQGNNNAYCQDNEIGWKDWKGGRTPKEFFKFIRQLIAFRRAHEILRMEQPMKLTDTKSCGCPDLSYHEESAWITPGYFNRKAIGVLYCGRYADEDEDVYIGFNFSDFPKKLALPKLEGRRKWHIVMDTAGRDSFLSEPEEIKEIWYILEAQSVCIIIGK